MLTAMNFVTISAPALQYATPNSSAGLQSSTYCSLQFADPTDDILAAYWDLSDLEGCERVSIRDGSTAFRQDPSTWSAVCRIIWDGIITGFGMFESFSVETHVSI